MKFPSPPVLADQTTRLAAMRACVLVLLLVVAQLGALGHALGHFKAGDDGGQAPETFCEWCAAYAQSGSALPAAGVAPLPAPIFAADTFAAPILPVRGVSFLAYRSQAPPALS